MQTDERFIQFSEKRDGGTNPVILKVKRITRIALEKNDDGKEEVRVYILSIEEDNGVHQEREVFMTSATPFEMLYKKIEELDLIKPRS